MKRFFILVGLCVVVLGLAACGQMTAAQESLKAETQSLEIEEQPEKEEETSSEVFELQEEVPETETEETLQAEMKAIPEETPQTEPEAVTEEIPAAKEAPAEEMFEPEEEQETEPVSDNTMEASQTGIVGAWQVGSDVFVFYADEECTQVSYGTDGMYIWSGQYIFNGSQLLIRWQSVQDGAGREYPTDMDVVYSPVEVSGDTIRIYDDGNGLFEGEWREGIRVE